MIRTPTLNTQHTAGTSIPSFQVARFAHRSSAHSSTASSAASSIHHACSCVECGIHHPPPASQQQPNGGGGTAAERRSDNKAARAVLSAGRQGAIAARTGRRGRRHVYASPRCAACRSAAARAGTGGAGVGLDRSLVGGRLRFGRERWMGWERQAQHTGISPLAHPLEAPPALPAASARCRGRDAAAGLLCVADNGAPPFPSSCGVLQ
eukprot:COSAG01_NODE_10554_length_2134_cov_1.374447_4_plen_208_part_00